MLSMLHARPDSLRLRAGLHVRRQRLHVRLVGLACCVRLTHYANASTLFIYHAVLHVRRPRLHVRSAGLACVRLTRYTHASICFCLPIHRAGLHVRCPRLHVSLVGLTCVYLLRCTRIWSLRTYHSELHVRPRDTCMLCWLGFCTPYALHVRRASFQIPS
jgi:hypothetical protein